MNTQGPGKHEAYRDRGVTERRKRVRLRRHKNSGQQLGKATGLCSPRRWVREGAGHWPQWERRTSFTDNPPKVTWAFSMKFKPLPGPAGPARCTPGTRWLHLLPSPPQQLSPNPGTGRVLCHPLPSSLCTGHSTISPSLTPFHLSKSPSAWIQASLSFPPLF